MQMQENAWFWVGDAQRVELLGCYCSLFLHSADGRCTTTDRLSCDFPIWLPFRDTLWTTDEKDSLSSALRHSATAIPY